MDSIFELEVKEKRAQAFLNKSKTGAKGGSKSRKGVRTPSDYMSKKELRELNGEVRTYNMNSLMDWKTFNEKSKEEQTRLLTHWRNIYSNAKIMDALQEGREKKFNQQSFADLVHELGVPKKNRINTGEPRKPRQAKKNVAITQAEPVAKLSLLEFAEQQPEPQPQPQPQPEPVQQIILKGMHFEYNGLYETDQINKILTKLQLLLEDEPNKFNVCISISEKTK